MTTNGIMLFLSLALLLVLQLIQGMHTQKLHGMGYALGPRDKAVDVGVFGSRLQRAKVNLIENLALFAPVSILGEVLQVNHAAVSLGAIIFLVARLVHVASYLGGISVIRTLSWFACLIGIVIVAVADLGWV